MGSKRVLRVAEAIKRETGVILDRKLCDPGVTMVTVTRVELSPDLRYAKVFVSLLGDDAEREEGMRRLRRARGFIRAQLAIALPLRVAPELKFYPDESAENYLRIDGVLRSIHEEDDDRLARESESGEDDS